MLYGEEVAKSDVVGKQPYDFHDVASFTKTSNFSLQGSDQSQLVADLRAEITTLLASVTQYKNAGQLVQEADAYLSQVSGITG